MRKNRKSIAERYEERRSRRLINKAIAKAPSQSIRNELVIAAQRQWVLCADPLPGRVTTPVPGRLLPIARRNRPRR